MNHDDPTVVEQRVRIVELCLVVMVGFGSSIFSSVYPLLGDGPADGWLRHSYFYLSFLLRMAIGLALLGYVLWRKGLSSRNAGPAPASMVTGLIGLLRQVSLFEWGLVSLVAFWYGLSLFIRAGLQHLDWAVLAQNLPAASSFVGMAIRLLLLGYVLTRTGRSFRDLGLSWSPGGAALAVPLFLLGTLINSVQQPLVYWLGRTFGLPGWHPPDVSFMIHGDGVSLAAIPDQLLVGFYEELIVRAYMMTEIILLTRKTWLAVIISVVVQVSYHFYQGVPLALSHVGLFTVFALFYARTRSILPIALAHSLVDLFATWNYGLSKMLPY